MPRGGKRAGAGRPAGVPNTATLARQKRVAATGVVPIDVMLDDMRYHHALALAELRKTGKSRDHAKISSELLAAREAARDVAPYIHPKLATLQSNVNLTGRLTLEDLVGLSMPAPANANAAGLVIEGGVKEDEA